MRRLVGILFVTIASHTLAAGAPVVDIEDQSASQAQSRQSQSPGQQAGAEIYYQLQMLQEEVRDLRGLVEQQSHEIRQLKQRQLDDYRDLDRRLSAVMSGGNQASAEPGNRPSVSSDPGLGRGETGNRMPDTTGAADGNAERESYNAAYDLLKNRKIDESVAAFEQHLETYPDGRYAANAHYWLGEVHLLQGNLDKARQSFSAVVQDFPAHRKASDAMFKLGKVYHLQGEDAKAQEMLNRVAQTNTTAASLAKAYLKENFR